MFVGVSGFYLSFTRFHFVFNSFLGGFTSNQSREGGTPLYKNLCFLRSHVNSRCFVSLNTFSVLIIAS